MKLLVQGDDYGFTKGVTYGIIEAIDNGILTCTGMFTNMEIAPWAAQFIKERPDFCFGIDFNLVAGPSCAPAEKIPHLVDEKGRLIRSNIRIHDPRWQSEEGRAELFPYDEVYTEIKAQYDRFIELTGRKPGYLNGHSIVAETMLKAMRKVAEDEDLPFAFDFMQMAFTTFSLPEEEDEKTNASVSKVFDPQAQLKKDPLGKFPEISRRAFKTRVCSGRRASGICRRRPVQSDVVVDRAVQGSGIRHFAADESVR